MSKSSELHVDRGWDRVGEAGVLGIGLTLLFMFLETLTPHVDHSSFRGTSSAKVCSEPKRRHFDILRDAYFKFNIRMTTPYND